ncbi:MAG: hypothetical protein RJA07_867 [Bacteroidota bacterium]|jgi:uncharacterized membrane protein YozB (DUF420 family)
MKKTIVVLLISIFIFLNKAKAEGEEIIYFYYGTAFLTGINMATSIANFNIIKEKNTRFYASQLTGIASGSVQMLIGAGFLADAYYSGYTDEIIFGTANVSIGLVTIWLSISSLSKRHKLLQLNKSTAWNINSVPLRNGSMGICFSLKHNF